MAPPASRESLEVLAENAQAPIRPGLAGAAVARGKAPLEVVDMILELNGRAPRLAEGVYVAPTAVLIGDVVAEEGASIWFGAVLRGDNASIRVGRRSNLQDNCVVHVDEGVPVTLGEDCVVGHAAVLHGCTLGNRVLVGIGARILDRAVVPDDVVIGAGALVPEGAHLESGYVYLGMPARRARPLREDERQRLAQGAAHYVQKGALYRQARQTTS